MTAQEPPMPPAIAEDFAFPRRRSSEHHDRPSISSSRLALKPRGFRAGVGLQNVARRTLGIFLLLATVFLWTSSNFLASVSCLLSPVWVRADRTSTSSQTTHIRNHTLLLSLIHPSLPYRLSPYFYAWDIDMALLI
jgi:hypothetical protein